MQPVRLSRVNVSNDPLDQIHKTLVLMGRAIKDGSEHLPIRNHAAALATTAKPRDYLGQLNAVYDSFVKNWRYVRDPLGKEFIHASPDAIYHMIIGGGKDDLGVGRGLGAGDCDDAAIALGAQLRSIGFPVRLAVTAPPGFPSGPSFTHVFAQASVPGVGWLTVDPVPYPRRGLGYTPEHSRIAYFNLEGRLIGHNGNVAGLRPLLGEEEIEMNTDYMPDLMQVQDMGLAGIDLEQTMPMDWRKYVLKDFGIYADRMGYMSGEGLGLAAEVDCWQEPDGQIVTRTPMLELAPDDYRHMATYGQPYHGMPALGDEGQQYTYDGFSGFFKKLARKIKKGIKKGIKAVGRGIKKVIKKIPGGKYLVKLGQKLKKVALKFTKPLIKFVGKYAAKLAPVASLIPGYGPAIAAGLHTAGKIANLMRKHGVELIGKKGKTRNLKFKSGDSAKAFKAELAAEAEKEQRKRSTKKTRRQTVRARRAPMKPRGIRALPRRATLKPVAARPGLQAVRAR